ncbi:MAG: metallophosphoesterase [Xanthomonadales bacterium]|nr:metallophosphoesterase [Xanthomonadales bacterium]
MQPIKLIQISDCHLPESPNTPYRGELVWQQLKDIIERVREWSPDAVVVSGDISEQAGAASYQFFRQTLESLRLPVYCQTGHHRACTNTKFQLVHLELEFTLLFS